MDDHNIEENLSADNVVANHHRENFVNEMAKNEYSHLETASEYEKRISAIKNASHVSIPQFSFIHNYLRMKNSWYYKWHLKNNFNKIHYFILIIFIIFILVLSWFCLK